MNFFASDAAAERYAKGRPDFHPRVVQKIASFLRIDEPVAAALDVACGTGLSSAALMGIARRVVGADASPEMLSRAPRTDRVEYVEAPAEDLPFGVGSFDLLTVSSAFHWFDRARFLSEAGRVLRPSGRLVIYDNHFSGRMKENPGYEEWHRRHYLPRFPPPSRDSTPLLDEEAERHGFSFIGREGYTNEVRFSAEGLAGYLETQSNVAAAVEEGEESIGRAHRWLVDSVMPLFSGSEGTFEFGGYVWFLRPREVDAAVSRA